MLMIRISQTAAVIALTAIIACAQNDAAKKMVGTWKLVSHVTEVQATGEKMLLMGKSPAGYAIFTSDGRAMFVLTGEGRKPAKTVDERADLFNTVVAYSGTYKLENDKWTTKVEVAWDPEWVGTEQTRFFKLEGDRLEVTTTWRIRPAAVEKGLTRAVLTFERSK
jgi:hypothetical protein